MKPEADPRVKADVYISHAFQIMADVRDYLDQVQRDYTPDELDDLFFDLGAALVQLKKLPGGEAARDRFYARAEHELQVRGRRDILDERDARSSLRRISDALDRLGVPRTTPPDESIDLESRVKQLGAERDRLRNTPRNKHRRVQKAVVVKYDDLTEVERYVIDRHPETQKCHGDGMWEVTRWDDSEAVKIVKSSLGANVDLSDGTLGDWLVRAIDAELDDRSVLCEKLFALANELYTSNEASE